MLLNQGIVVDRVVRKGLQIVAVALPFLKSDGVGRRRVKYHPHSLSPL